MWLTYNPPIKEFNKFLNELFARGYSIVGVENCLHPETGEYCTKTSIVPTSQAPTERVYKV